MARHIGSLSPLGAIVEPTVESASAVSGTGTTTGVGVAASALEVGTANAAPSIEIAASTPSRFSVNGAARNSECRRATT